MNSYGANNILYEVKYFTFDRKILKNTMKRTSKNILKNLNMIFIPSIVGRILGWPQDFISLMYMLYINPSSRGWAGPVNMMGCHSKDSII